METLDEDWDIIVIGTGMIESILSAAASRIGKKVLHLDSSDYYGGLWTSYSLEALIKTVENAKLKQCEEESNLLQFRNVQSEWYIKEEIIPVVETDNHDPLDEKDNESNLNKINTIKNGRKEKTTVWNKNSLLKESRRFNIDIIPKLLFARGELVELLISSNIARYAEFRCVNRVLTWIDEKLEHVPCSRKDVFATKNVSVVEKRMLMKLLTSFMEYDPEKSTEFKAYENKTFRDYLNTKKLTANLIHNVVYAIAGVTETTNCIEGIKRCKRFLISLGRYGNTPFLCSMYGCGELPQCFCRLSAVFGGTYCLNTPVKNISAISDDSEYKVGISIESKDLKCQKLIMGVDKAPKAFIATEFTKGISRAIFITNKSILSFPKESLTLLRIPPIEKEHDLVTVIELGPSTSCCPEGLYLIHMTCKQKVSAHEDLFPYADKILSFEQCDSIETEKIIIETTKPKVLWGAYFNIMDISEDVDSSDSENIYLCSGPDSDLDYDGAVIQAKKLFHKMFKDAEFLPRAPDPEEIVFDDAKEPGPAFTSSKDEIHETETKNNENVDDKTIENVENTTESTEKQDKTENIEKQESQNVEKHEKPEIDNNEQVHT